MPGVYTGEYIVVRAPADGTHTGKRGPESVRKGDLVYLHPGHTAVFGNLTVSYPHDAREGRPYIELESK